jgi:hypothetical protein
MHYDLEAAVVRQILSQAAAAGYPNQDEGDFGRGEKAQ